ncbi:C2H2 type zinc finger domain protein [Aspergillus ellipticus CBS 707.79]|uniref:C2H2 type zinc finger domain protein n=1 Tax=Aspergillus ellipticus CBS 707.79 TaxID=1448320 RepID=A0A319D1U6_9EURO|nr:C2H2 type zinc finger domain protein [Aspergillus ellipticus CBS 707.79]
MPRCDQSSASAPPRMAPLEALFACSHPGCGRGYRRKEHLNRHAASHRQHLTSPCPFCLKVFARNDTLRQHVRLNHKDKVLNPTRALKACNHCRSRRSRCDGKAPCDACQQKGLRCSLADASSDGHPAEEQDTKPPTSGTGSPIGEAAHATADSHTSTRPRSQATSVEKPAVNTQRYVDAYFEVFHPIWPFLHQATFDADREPPFLRQSVMMMGLWMTGDPELYDVAIELHNKLTHSIYQQRNKWDRSQMGSSALPMATYQGILIQLIFALLMDNPNPLDMQMKSVLPEAPTRLLKALVRACRRQNMFFYPAVLAKFNPGEVPDVFIWVGVEEVKRFGLALYKVCKLYHIERDGDSGESQGLLSLADLQFAMPDSDERWHASADLAATLAKDDPMTYSSKNIEANWISQSARILCRSNVAFDWI